MMTMLKKSAALLMALILLLTLGLAAMAETATNDAAQTDATTEQVEELTDEEIEELENIYERVSEIYEAIYGDDDSLTNRQYRERVAPFEEELDRLEDRMLELEAKGGLDEDEEDWDDGEFEIEFEDEDEDDLEDDLGDDD